MVDQLNAFAGEVTRVAREVGTDGKLGGQAEVPGRRRNLERSHRQRELHGLVTSQVRFVTSLKWQLLSLGGDLSRKITVDVRGEILS